MTNFGMFTYAGNFGVSCLVDTAKAQKWDWSRTYRELCAMAEEMPDVYGEATDTAVREAVYDACGFETEFYV